MSLRPLQVLLPVGLCACTVAFDPNVSDGAAGDGGASDASRADAAFGPCTSGTTHDCYTGPDGTENVGVCKPGLQTCNGGVWGACVGDVKPGTETCNASDDDCDGAVDEGCACTPGSTQPCGSDVGECTHGTQSCAGSTWGDCQGGVKPQPETCDNRDNDCDTLVDEALSQVCYDGPPATRFVGACREGNRTCAAGVWGSCLGQVLPGTESCDNKDNDCDSSVDETLTRGCYEGAGGTQGVGPCKAGSQTCASGSWGTCSGQVLPAASDPCDGVDNNCNGPVDDQCHQVTCKVFWDAYADEQGPADSIFGPAVRSLCIPGGADGVCRQWFGRCTAQAAPLDGHTHSVGFSVFDDGYSNMGAQVDAVCFQNPFEAVSPEAGGTVRRWFGRATAAPSQGHSHDVGCHVFDDGYTNMAGPSDAILWNESLQFCNPGGACRRWFGRCRTL